MLTIYYKNQIREILLCFTRVQIPVIDKTGLFNEKPTLILDVEN
jgi:hypothetical protein